MLLQALYQHSTSAHRGSVGRNVRSNAGFQFSTNTSNYRHNFLRQTLPPSTPPPRLLTSSEITLLAMSCSNLSFVEMTVNNRQSITVHCTKTGIQIVYTGFVTQQTCKWCYKGFVAGVLSSSGCTSNVAGVKSFHGTRRDQQHACCVLHGRYPVIAPPPGTCPRAVDIAPHGATRTLT